jgi:tetratricopeptide (TPR) repeat protein
VRGDYWELLSISVTQRGVMIEALVILVVAVAGPVVPLRPPLVSEARLLAGDSLPGAATMSFPTPSIDDAFSLDEAMRTFVAPLISTEDDGVRLFRLREAMQRDGLFALDYSNESTRTARQTFHDRRGNCLSFTMLFVALAREIGLDVRFNVVDVPPVFDNESGRVVVGRHVNAMVVAPGGRTYIVDFNEPNYREKYPYRTVGDARAAALFYSNLGAEALLAHDYGRSLALLREAARNDPDVAAVWINLGLLYLRYKLYEHAESATLRALEADAEDPSALGNLAVIYSAMGERRLAAVYRHRLRGYRKLNPYYHFALAQEAYTSGRYKDVLRDLRRALRLKADDEFYRLEARAFAALGRSDKAALSEERADVLALVQ